MSEDTRPPLTAEEKRSALNEALNSTALARSGRLRNLLRFLCEAEIEHRSELSEYEIGVQALGQPPTYSPAENSTVRSRVYELRHRLETYYASEGLECPVRIQLGKGSYVPGFVRCDAGTRHSGGGIRWLSGPVKLGAAAFLAGALCMSIVWWAVGGAASGRTSARAMSVVDAAWTPELQAIWAPFVDPAAPALLSFESRLFVRIGSVNVRDWNVDEMARIESSRWLMAIKQLFHQPQLYENRNYADFGTVLAAFEIGKLVGSRNPRLVLKRSSELTPEDTRERDIIFLSKPSTDPALRQLLAAGPFVDERLRVHNLDPKPGELSEYEAKPDPKDPDRSGERYLVITLIPGLYENRRILSLACFNSEDSWALAEYLTSPEHARQMYAKMRLPNGKMPRFYQVLVKAAFRAQSPIQVEYVTHRVLSKHL